MLSSDTAQIFFEDVRVPAKNLIGEEGKGFTYQMMQVNVSFIREFFLTILEIISCLTKHKETLENFHFILPDSSKRSV